RSAIPNRELATDDDEEEAGRAGSQVSPRQARSSDRRRAGRRRRAVNDRPVRELAEGLRSVARHRSQRRLRARGSKARSEHRSLPPRRDAAVAPRAHVPLDERVRAMTFTTAQAAALLDDELARAIERISARIVELERDLAALKEERERRARRKEKRR